jgi:mono/diheme cytochrome c family protein
VFRRVSILGVVASIAIVAGVGVFSRGWAQGDAAVDYTKITPVDLVNKTPKGKIVNPYKDTQADIVAEGSKFFQSYSCSGCHGGTAGGGMCPPLTNDTWVYGGDDDTLFRLVTLGSDGLQKVGYMRKGHENVVGPMPPFGAIIKSADDLFKVFAFVRSKYNGDPAYKLGDPTAAAEPANP